MIYKSIRCRFDHFQQAKNKYKLHYALALSLIPIKQKNLMAKRGGLKESPLKLVGKILQTMVQSILLPIHLLNSFFSSTILKRNILRYV